VALSFGFSGIPDLLSWAIVALLGLKVVATAILLRIPPDARFATGRRRALWWSTKITPLLVVPSMIALARAQGRIGDAWVFAGLLAFVLIAVPLTVRRRFVRVDPATRPG
jgi:hypothetical protein